MRTPAPEQEQRAADLLGWQAEQRFAARRRQTQRALGAGKDKASRATSTRGSGARRMAESDPGQTEPVRALGIRHPHPTPWLLITVLGSLGGLFVLAVVGAYQIIGEVFNHV